MERGSTRWYSVEKRKIEVGGRRGRRHKLLLEGFKDLKNMGYGKRKH
jgi:hypothetical protein